MKRLVLGLCALTYLVSPLEGIVWQEQGCEQDGYELKTMSVKASRYSNAIVEKQVCVCTNSKKCRVGDQMDPTTITRRSRPFYTLDRETLSTLDY